MQSALPANPETCPRCYVGRITFNKLNLVTLVSGNLLTVPDFPAWVCDVCHAYIYDPKALARLHAVLNTPPAKRPPQSLKTSGKAAQEIKTPKSTSLSN